MSFAQRKYFSCDIVSVLMVTSKILWSNLTAVQTYEFTNFMLTVLSMFSQVMAAPVIPILSDSSEESVGSHAPQVILFGIIPIIIPVILEVPADPLAAPEVGAVSVTSHAGVLDLVDYSSSTSDLSEDSLPPTPELPLVSPFLCSDDSEADSESELAEQRLERHESLVAHDAMVLRWRDRVASRPSSSLGSSSHDTFAPLSEFPIVPVVASPEIRQRPAILIRPEEAIPFGRPYRTHPNGSRKLLTARKRVGPFPARRLARRRVSHHLSDRHSSPDFTSDSYSSGSSSNSSSVHSSGFDASCQTHSGPSTRVASSRLVYPPVWELRLLLVILRRQRPVQEAEASAGGTVEVEVDPRVRLVVDEDVHNHVTADGAVEVTYETLGDLVQRFHDHTEEIPVHRIQVIETAQRQLERDWVDSLRHHMALSQEEFRQIRRDRDDARRRFRRLKSFVERRLGFRP
ncbi:hypothetical protein Tco_1301641 [Tanacetum coccineum]